MFLSQVELDPSASKNPYDWHKILWQHFPGREDDARDFLFRIEGSNLETGKTLALLQSSIIPKTDGTQSFIKECPKSVDFNASIKNEIYRFKITANVIKTIKDKENRERKIRVPLIKEEEQIEWLKRKFDTSADILNVRVGKNPPIYFKRKGDNGKLVTVTFEGLLKVKDPDSMIKLIRLGVGPAKAFGCGLISLVRYSNANLC